MVDDRINELIKKEKEREKQQIALLNKKPNWGKLCNCVNLTDLSHTNKKKYCTICGGEVKDIIMGDNTNKKRLIKELKHITDLAHNLHMGIQDDNIEMECLIESDKLTCNRCNQTQKELKRLKKLQSKRVDSSDEVWMKICILISIIKGEGD